jgi:hypothetical protein
MDLLNVALQVIAIITIIAVGAFIIVFLSDLLISIIDNHQGIFFRRGKGRSEPYENTYNYNYTQNKDKAPFQEDKIREQTFDSFDFNDDFEVKKEEPKGVEPTNPFKKKFVDLDAAAREQEMVEKAKGNFFDDEEEEESEEEKAAKERMARLEERNRQLEEELKAKEQSKEERKKDSIKFDDMVPTFKDESIDKGQDEEDDDLEGYEALIKKINAEVKQDFVKGNVAKDSSEEEQEQEEFEETFEEEDDNFEDEFVTHAHKQKDNYSDLEKQIAELKAQLEEERRQAEELKKEAEEKAAILLEEKQKFEQTIKQQANNSVKEDGSVVFASEEEYVARLKTLEERLKEAKKELRKNKREFVPLNKIKRTLEKDQVKLRRKEAKVAKAKVALFGVNNSDIDPEKQAELEQEIDMLEGLKLSVQHCEDVMSENEDRYPILEQTHKILTKNVNDLISDIELIEKKLKEIRAKK